MHKVCQMLVLQLHILHWPTPYQCWHAPESLEVASGQVAFGYVASGGATPCCTGHLHIRRNCIACSWDAHVSPQAWPLSSSLWH